MKILKAPRFSFLFKPFMQRQKVELVVTMLNFIPFRKPEEPMLEEEAWPSIGAQLGDVPLDVGDFKATGEWLAYGSAYAGALKEAGNIDVSVSINKKKKCLRVFGEREWIAQVNKPISMTDPIPFSSMPIIPSFAYGGREFKDNPAGIGHWDAKQESDRYLLPRIMYPESIMNAPEDTLLPGYFSSRDIMLPERQQYAGTYDELWAETSFPGLPDDFNPRMNQLAQEDQHLETFGCFYSLANVFLCCLFVVTGTLYTDNKSTPAATSSFCFKVDKSKFHFFLGISTAAVFVVCMQSGAWLRKELVLSLE